MTVWVRLTRWRALASVALLIAVVAGGLWLAARPAAEDEWAQVARADIVLGVEITGVLKATRSELVGPPAITDVWEFKISFLAPEGSKVTRGQPVLGFDTSALQQELHSKTAEHDQAVKEIERRQTELTLARHDDELKLAEAEAELRKARLKAELPDELVSNKELEKARLDLALAERVVAALRRRLDATRRAGEAELAALRDSERRIAIRLAVVRDGIAGMTIASAADGTVIYVTDWRFEKKKVGDTCWRLAKVLEIPDLRTLGIKGEVDERDAGRVAIGQPVTLRLDALAEVELTGRVVTVARAVERKQGQTMLRIVRVDAVLDRCDPERMRPGMRFRGQVEVGRVREAVVVPAETVFPAPDGPIVYRRTALGVAATPVTVGERNERLVEIRSGVARGDRVARRAPEQGGR